MHVLATTLPGCILLAELDLSNNAIGDAGATMLASALPQCLMLTMLCITGNPLITAVGEKQLIGAVPRCPLLRTLRIRSKVKDMTPLGTMLSMQPWRKEAAEGRRWLRLDHAQFGPVVDAMFGVVLLALTWHGCTDADMNESILERVGLYDM